MQSDTEQVYEFLLEALIPHLEEKGRHWLLECLSDPELYATLDRRMAAARRKVGAGKFPFHCLWPPSVAFKTESPGDGWDVRGWDVSDAARICILLRIQYGQAHPEEWIKQALRQGDERERCAIMKGLLLLDPGGDLLSLCVDSCRTNSLDLFSAIAVWNPYPFFFFSEPEFNQLVLKSLFLDLDIAHIYGLRQRITESLIRMCEDFREERKAAGRDVPGSIRLILS